MTTLLRPAAFIAAVMVGLFGLVAAPMSVQAEETVVTPIIDGDGFIRPPCASANTSTCNGWCSILVPGTCKPGFTTVTTYIYIGTDPRTGLPLYATNTTNTPICECKP